MNLRYIIEFHPTASKVEVAEAESLIKRLSGEIENNGISYDGRKYRASIVIPDVHSHEFLRLSYISKMYLDSWY